MTGCSVIFSDDIKSKPGHILGHAVNRSATAREQRKLTPLSCAVMRCLTHISILTSAVLNPNKVC